ncbi:universal stress protein [Caenimonas terrae]|uniref:Universal stress protein n=1 Tax=Caenimonas terrae TaxID=696074 RepID=A0ABW0NAT8_9BURK
MKVLFAADGSEYTKKALAFLVTNGELIGADGEVVVLNVQPPMPPRVIALAGADAVHDYHKEEAGKVLEPIKTFMARHPLRFRSSWVVGPAAEEIIKAAHTEKAGMIVMGTHGHGVLARALLGSVAQRVVVDSDLPVLLVK